jgi:2,3-diketo-5-methylthio-1-phosphopentane phosphatase
MTTFSQGVKFLQIQFTNSFTPSTNPRISSSWVLELQKNAQFLKIPIFTVTNPTPQPLSSQPKMAEPPLPKYIFFTDFDGTITRQDSNDHLINNFGLGPALRKQLFSSVLTGDRSFRSVFKECLDSITLPLDQCIEELLRNIELDEGFKDFHSWARDNGVPVVVLSGGMEPIIRALLSHLLGEEEAKSLPILSNNVTARPGKKLDEEGGWEIAYRDDR